MQVGLQERRDEAAAGGVDVDWDIQSVRGGPAVERPGDVLTGS